MKMMILLAFLLLFTLLILAYLLNRRLKAKIASQRFNIFADKRRNFDELVIGIPNSRIEYGKDNTYYSIWINRSLYASFVILKALFSIIKEDGTGKVTIYTNRNFDGVGFFDYAILHDRTIEEENCAPSFLMKKLPLLYYMLQFFQRIKRREVVSRDKWNNLCNVINLFCKERGIIVNIIEI